MPVLPEPFLAKSLRALRDEVDTRWPNRDTASDGWLGDAAHSTRTSDHNPDWQAPGARSGVVRALDIDKDGIDVPSLLRATIGDDRVWYVIWDRTIYSRTYGWAGRDYDGPNPHTGHIHISIQHTLAAETDVSPWFKEDDMTPEQAAKIITLLEELTAQGRLAAVRLDSLVNKQLPDLRADADRIADDVVAPD